MPDSSRLFLILPLSALVIAGLCAYKLSRPSDGTERSQPISIDKRAPLFELYDQGKPPQSVRLERYIGRHRIVLVFFQPEGKLANDPVLVWLKDRADILRNEEVKVLAISTLLPQDHRKLLKEFADEDGSASFQMFSDLNGEVHRLYGLPDPRTSKIPTTVFLIDRTGNLTWNQEKPIPLKDPIRDLAAEFGVE